MYSRDGSARMTGEAAMAALDGRDQSYNLSPPTSRFAHGRLILSDKRVQFYELMLLGSQRFLSGRCSTRRDVARANTKKDGG
jgi:hypothetical protein